ncbi:MAG: PEPxxWA-CTERM sorting domain-containing protein [Gemmatimonas sp.]
MFVHARRRLASALSSAALVAAGALIPSTTSAQSRTFEACSQGALQNCAGIRLTSQLGVGPSNTNLFEIAIQNLGSQAFPSVPTSLYILTLLTGQAPDANVVDALPTPTATGGASVSDNAAWSLFESGDAIFLSSLANTGIGGCATGAAAGLFAHMGNTCGSNQFISFSFFTERTFDVNAITLAGLEFVALDANDTADSCNDFTPCLVTDVAVVPEPSTWLLMMAGLSAVGVAARRRSLTPKSEA